MEHDFWHQKWVNNQIGFHLSDVNPLLLQHFSALTLDKGARIFVPLCGKTLDIGWLLAQGHQVVGIELSEIAIQALFSQLNLTAEITQTGALKLYQAENIAIFVGDFFALSQAQLGNVDAVYDRAAFIALPDGMRKRYSDHLIALTQAATQLLITLDYDPALHQGPPFAITTSIVQQHYADDYTIQHLASKTMPDGLKGQYPATEQVWLLQS